MKKEKIIALFTAVALMVSLCCMNVSAVESVPMENPSLVVNAKAAILMEPETGKVLFEMNPDEKLSAASVTKVMTLLLVIEAIDSGKMNLDDVVTASPYAVSMGGSQIWLKEGEEMTVDELLKATFVASANDAAVALGEAVAGSNDAFIEMMNAKAKQLGMLNTTYKNATGLDEDGHLTTARDIALVSSEIIKYEMIKDYTLIWMDYLRDGATELVNTNKLIKSYEGITGLKTGTTSTAGSCLAATAERDGLKLVSVVLGAENSADRFSGTTTMLDYGFSSFEITSPQISGEMLGPVKVISGMQPEVKIAADISDRLLVSKGRSADVVINIDVEEQLKAPVTAGENIGTITLSLDDVVLGEYPITTQENIQAVQMWLVVKSIIKKLIQP